MGGFFHLVFPSAAMKNRERRKCTAIKITQKLFTREKYL
jgi:hypothetical protein